MMHKAIAAVRAKSATVPIVVLYEDQPTNDFKPLFMMTQGLMPGPKSYLQDFDGVFVMASGTSFYAPCSPPGTVDLGFSATAMHWLRRTPCHIKSALHSAMATAEENAQYAAQADKDWRRILLQRASEMKAGAKAVFVNFSTDSNGCYLGNTAAAGGPGVSMHSKFSEIWASFAAKGTITQEEYEATNFPQHYRTEAQYTAALTEADSEVSKAGLKLLDVHNIITPCPYRAGWLAGKYESPEAFAADYIGTLRSWSSGVFLTGLNDSRTAEEKQAIVDAFYTAYQADVAGNPGEHGMDYVHAVLTVAKE